MPMQGYMFTLTGKTVINEAIRTKSREISEYDAAFQRLFETVNKILDGFLEPVAEDGSSTWLGCEKVPVTLRVSTEDGIRTVRIK
jgi:hypothetical protein